MLTRAHPACGRFALGIRLANVRTYEVESWRIDYNLRRPHTSLGGLTPAEFIKQYQSTQNSRSPRPDIWGGLRPHTGRLSVMLAGLTCTTHGLVENGLEGVVVSRSLSPYLPGPTEDDVRALDEYLRTG